MEEKPTDVEIVKAFINVICTPLARAIVSEMKAQGLVVPQPEVQIRLDTKFFEQGMEEAMGKLIEANLAVPTAAQIPCQGTCGTCMWCPKNTCHREGSPFHTKPVKPDQSCDLYRPAETPKHMTIPEPLRKQRPYARAKCDTCGAVHTINKEGKLYPHDVHGVTFRLAQGDRSKPCPGKPVKESA